MKERPILFSAPMIRAILAGTKTQTRRIVKWRGLDKSLNLNSSALYVERSGSNWVLASPTRTTYEYHSVPMPCPYGQPEQRLWVRESGWERPQRTPKMMREGADTWEPYYYDADGLSQWDVEEFKEWGFKRRPSIHMPRWASRITLEVTDVRVQRLTEISEADAMAEGAPPSHPSIDAVSRSYGYPDFPRSWFAQTWDAINGPGAWARNDWVFVISFRRV